jgi:hypothetical protein
VRCRKILAQLEKSNAGYGNAAAQKAAA